MKVTNNNIQAKKIAKGKKQLHQKKNGEMKISDNNIKTKINLANVTNNNMSKNQWHKGNKQ